MSTAERARQRIGATACDTDGTRIGLAESHVIEVELGRIEWVPPPAVSLP